MLAACPLQDFDYQPWHQISAAAKDFVVRSARPALAHKELTVPQAFCPPNLFASCHPASPTGLSLPTHCAQSRLLHKDPSKRMSVSQGLRHPWIVEENAEVPLSAGAWALGATCLGFAPHRRTVDG